jgi:hypothetical protein
MGPFGCNGVGRGGWGEGVGVDVGLGVGVGVEVEAPVGVRVGMGVLGHSIYGGQPGVAVEVLVCELIGEAVGVAVGGVRPFAQISSVPHFIISIATFTIAAITMAHKAAFCELSKQPPIGFCLSYVFGRINGGSGLNKRDFLSLIRIGGTVA